VRIREVLRLLIAIAHVPVEVRHDPTRMRPSDVPSFYGDNVKLHAATGWLPEVPLADSLHAVYDAARSRAGAAT
jgi:GDP-4-dehydro-6-deoxy-D-mannose reductase